MKIRDEYRIALDICPTPLMLVSHLGDIILCNQRFAQLFGYQDGELHGQMVEVLVPEEIRKFHPELRQAFFEVPTNRKMGTGRDLQGLHKDGSMIPVEIGLDPVASGADSPVMVSVLDIRERKAGEAKIRRAINAAASAMVMIDEQGKIELVNEPATRMFGYEEQALIGSKIETLIPERYHRKHSVYRASYQSVRNRREMGAGRELFGRKEDGTEFPVEIGLTPLDGADGRLIMATIIDVTERRENEINTRLKNEELQRLNDELGAFAYSASHDLKAPLSSIAGILDLMAEDLENGDLEETRDNIERARKLARRLSARIEGMLSLAKNDHLENRLEEVSIADMVSETCNGLLDGSNTPPEISTAYAHSDPIRSVPLRVGAILENLLSNAFKYRDPKKPQCRIHIETWDEGEGIRLALQDNGIGIPADHLAKIFTLFKRVANTDEPGSGLGLTLVEKNLRHLGGSIEVESSDKGSRFTIFLPHNRETAGSAEADPKLEFTK